MFDFLSEWIEASLRPPDLYQQLVEAVARKDRAKKELEIADAELKGLKERVLDRFEQDGLDRVSVGGKTVFPKRTLWAGRKDCDPGQFYKALKDFPELAPYARETTDTQGFSAFIRRVERELEEENPGEILGIEDLQLELLHRYPGVGELIKLTEKFDVGVQTSKASTARQRRASSKDEGPKTLDKELGNDTINF